MSAADYNRNITSKESKVFSRKNVFDSGSVKLVMAGTGCANMDRVEQVKHDSL